jgi:hypothetical protein
MNISLLDQNALVAASTERAKKGGIKQPFFD